MNNKYLKISEVANQLRVKDETVRRWIRNKKLHGTKINGHYLITEGELIEFTLNKFAKDVGLPVEKVREIIDESN